MRRTLRATEVEGIWSVHYGIATAMERIGYVFEDLGSFLALSIKLRLIGSTLPHATREEAAQAVVEWHEAWLARYALPGQPIGG